MYKVPIEVLEIFKDQLKLTSEMLDVSHKGGKLHVKEVNSILDRNIKLIELIKENYGI
jgi:hypothetical protein